MKSLPDAQPGWTRRRLKHRTGKIGSGKTPSGGSSAYVDDGIAFIRSLNIYDDGFREADLVRIDQTTDREMHGTRVRPGDVLLNITGASIGRSCKAPVERLPANVNQHVCIIRPAKALHPDYLSYLLKSKPTKEQIQSYQQGASREGLNFAQVGDLEYLEPPLPTQKAIADFLDRKTAAIDALIEKKQKLLDLLAEKRAALINQAVTKGLDPNVPMKDSGIPWIGAIPAHWEVKRLKQLGNLKGGAGFPDTEQGVEGEDIPFFKVKHLATVGEGGTLDSSDDTVSVMTAARLRAHVFAAGTVVFAKVGAALLLRRYRLLGRPSCIDNNMLGFTVHEKWMDVGFLMPSLTLLPFDLLVNPGAVPSISAGQVGSFPLATPPVEEQRQIADHLNRELAKADKATRSIVNQLNKLAEYRQALITAAVTGQLDIGEEAA